METLCSVNWPSVIFDDIVIAAKLWRSKKRASTNPSMHGCLMFLLVYYLDNLLGQHSTDPQLTPRVAHITKQQLLNLIEEDKQVVQGVKTFGALPLRSQQGTCYMEDTSTSTCVPPDTQAADNPSASHSIPSGFFPSMLHHLAGCSNVFSVEDQLAAKEALQRCDEDVGKLTLQIRDTQMATIQEIKFIVRDSHSRTSPPPQPEGRDAPNSATAQSPLEATDTAPNTDAARQRQPPSSLVDGDLDIEDHTDVTDDIPYTQIIMGDGFNKLSTSQQDAFMDNCFGHPDVSELPLNSHDSPHDYPHEVLTNGVCKTCHDLDEMCKPDDELRNEEEDVDSSAADQALPTAQEGNELSGLRAQVDADSPGMASPMTPHIFCPLRNIVSDPSFQDLPTKYTLLPPPAFDKTPNQSQDSLTPSVVGAELVTQLWEVSQQLRDAGVQNTPARNKLPYLPSPVYDKTLSNMKTTTKISRLNFSSPSNSISMTRNSKNKVFHSRVFHGNNPPKTSRRNKHLSYKLISPFKCPPNKGLCPIPMDSSLALRDTVVWDASLFNVPLISNDSLGVCSYGEALASSFKDTGLTLIEIMNFFTECLRHDEKQVAPHCRGYRLFLSWTLGSLLNCEELLPGQVYDSSMAVKYLSEHLNGVDPKEIKLILWTYHHNNHFSVYCVNRVNTRIDVLDSIDWSKNGGSFEERNDPWGYTSIKRLSDAFQTVTCNQFEDFSEWPIWNKDVPRQHPLGNSCASFTKMFLRHYDGEENQLRCTIEPGKENYYRAEDLSYILFHDLNETRPLPDSLEKFRPSSSHL